MMNIFLSNYMGITKYSQHNYTNNINSRIVDFWPINCNHKI